MIIRVNTKDYKKFDIAFVSNNIYDEITTDGINLSMGEQYEIYENYYCEIPTFDDSVSIYIDTESFDTNVYIIKKFVESAECVKFMRKQKLKRVLNF